MSAYRTKPVHSEKMPSGIPYIISNEAAERFSFYGMKGILAVFLVNYLTVLGGENYSKADATAITSFFNTAAYLTPLIGAIIADTFFGKYKTIIRLSIVYCLGHACLAFMGIAGPPKFWMLAGLGLISLGSGGIKPCVSAHVGDQFGTANQHLLTRIFNIFYFSINFGAVISNLAIPIVLKYHGPHFAFGIPGILMAVATICFWMGRHKFVHVPAHGRSFLKEVSSREGLAAIGKLVPLYLFVAVFWCLFDQTANTLVFQAERMDRHIMFGWEILPSQIQFFNPFMILVLIPLFTFVIYPFVEKRITLTPLRKIGAGLFLMVVSFTVVSLSQESIDRGGEPHVIWQLLAYVIFTSAEILISIVCLEFSYTQAPKKMKSFIMGLFLASVSLGNAITGVINLYIQVPDVEVTAQAHPGFDSQLGTKDDLTKQGEQIQSPVTELLQTTADRVLKSYEESAELPIELDGLPVDPWGNPLRYQFIHKGEARVISDGPDESAKTKWDLGITITVKEIEKVDPDTWLYREKQKLGLLGGETKTDKDESPLDFTYTAGGGLRLEQAAYFWFFTILMLVTAILFIPFAFLYKPRTYLQDEGDPADEIHPVKP